jgi:ParB-like chromosome segregation protein Spo0J
MKEFKKLTLEEICKLEFHPLANLFPLLSAQELEELAGDIERNGLKETIVLFEGQILDGRNRYLAARKLGLGTDERGDWYPFVHFETFPRRDGYTLAQAAAAFVITKNIMRRNLSEDQRAMIAAKLYAKLPNKPKHGGDRKSSASLPASELDSTQSATNLKAGVANQMKVSVKQLERAGTLQKKSPGKAAEVEAGTKTLAEAEKEVGTKPQKVKLKSEINAPPPPPPPPPPEPKKPKFTFDAVGVSKYITDQSVRNWFWGQCELAKMPFAWQAKLAALIAEDAAFHNKGVVSLPFIKHFEQYIRLWAEYPGIDIDQADMDEILSKLNEEKLQALVEKLKKQLFALARVANELAKVTENVPSTQLLGRMFDRQFRRYGLQWVKQTVDKLVEKFPPN